ncbi:MAG: hypothetical protein WBJ51_06400 [Methanoculleus sp.]|jgi:hypothetical protein
MRRGFRVTYEIISHESAEQGDVEERGFLEEDGIDISLDEFDIEEGISIVDKAVEFLRDNTGSDGIEPSSTGKMGEEDWWTSYKHNEDFRTGTVENRSYHPYGFTVEEINQINNRLKERN